MTTLPSTSIPVDLVDSRGGAKPRRSTEESGFTLIEVIVVVGVLSILATTLSPLLVKQAQRRRLEVTEERLQRVAEALSDYYYDREAFPAALDDAGFLADYLAGVVRGEPSKDPMVRYQSDFGYVLTGPNGQCTLYSRGENGIDNGGTGDDIAISISSGPSGLLKTRSRLGLIGVALKRYLDADPSHQLTGDWAGTDRTALGLSSEYDQDAWGIGFQSVAGQAMVKSAGPDRLFSTSDDLTL